MSSYHLTRIYPAQFASIDSPPEQRSSNLEPGAGTLGGLRKVVDMTTQTDTSEDALEQQVSATSGSNVLDEADAAKTKNEGCCKKIINYVKEFFKKIGEFFTKHLGSCCSKTWQVIKALGTCKWSQIGGIIKGNATDGNKGASCDKTDIVSGEGKSCDAALPEFNLGDATACDSPNMTVNNVDRSNPGGSVSPPSSNLTSGATQHVTMPISSIRDEGVTVTEKID